MGCLAAGGGRRGGIDACGNRGKSSGISLWLVLDPIVVCSKIKQTEVIMIRCGVAVLAVVLGLSYAVPAVAQSPDALKGVHIDNFGQVDQFLYRGAQPVGQDYEALKALGIKAVVDLEYSGKESEQRDVESLGMKFIRIGMSDHSRPDAGAVGEFLKAVADPANQPVFVHCHGGRDRTGAMTAVYRMTHDGWTADQALNEMRQYRFGQGVGHGVLKDYIFEYYSGLTTSKQAAPAKNDSQPVQSAKPAIGPLAAPPVAPPVAPMAKASQMPPSSAPPK
ncbi:MAG TPA: dual specificity protein phosphatase family protein [Blastocatellia bacterium]|nr:dual specificity protein phosphatase family protein [Blastocatellia bacterium]